MKNTIVVVLLMCLVLFFGFADAGAGETCCMKTPCECAQQACCAAEECACKAGCCQGAACNCVEDCGCAGK